jgi:hypothetical protein
VSAQTLSEFYGLIGDLTRRTGGPRILRDCAGSTGWPERGVYFFFEPGETRPDGSPRVVRVGTQGLTTGSSSTLWKRLHQHKGQRSGGGNHRGSVFRLHVGAALIARGDVEGVSTWGQRSSAARAVRETEREIEEAVSTYIGSMPFLWLGVYDEPGATSDRGVIESGSIAALSRLANRSADPPSPDWLGNYSARSDIRRSGLWNVRHVTDPVSDRFLERLAYWTERT